MVRAVYLHMAIQAILRKQKLRRHAPREAICIQRDTRMARLRVALLAKLRTPPRKRARVYRPMRFMTIRTILENRGMLPEKRPAQLGMALIAGGIERGFDQRELAVDAVMRIMTIAAGHFAGTKRMAIRLVRIGALGDMTAPADFRLSGRRHHRILSGVAAVTICTANCFIGVGATVPAGAQVRIVAIQTHAVLHIRQGGVVRGKRNQAGAFLAGPDAARMRATGAVTSLALQLAGPERTVRIGRNGVITTK